MAVRPESLPVIWASLVLALLLQVMPLPEEWLLWRPDWLGMMLAFWCIVAPQRVGVFYGFIFGLLLDLLEGSPLGQNALLMSLLTWLCLLLYSRLRVYSLWQQAALITIVLGLIQLIDQWLRVVFDVASLHLEFVYAAVIGGVLWPWFFTLMQHVRRRFR
ncbi:rod shape-determining protein MreD [Kushneria phosphatilytica]|uniref:Rod shape-determining protein MreD n=1 Tax=Kushneria phosphatilytica TaxID=657387 RepID=A0A1S1NXV4_9GAMM|nr:rod shape-determining protein MreD [Kushneria phosphatilytica]OHV12267.1 rod shape-determining protein MreD [Kushneria phosphatilytica]QEL11467.1 rod shape-determining protein MreD [Kushneria phosphatilytica]